MDCTHTAVTNPSHFIIVARPICLSPLLSLSRIYLYCRPMRERGQGKSLGSRATPLSKRGSYGSCRKMTREERQRELKSLRRITEDRRVGWWPREWLTKKKRCSCCREWLTKKKRCSCCREWLTKKKRCSCCREWLTKKKRCSCCREWLEKV